LLPLRTEDDSGEKVPVDLHLRRREGEGELTPENPLVEVAVPAQFGEGIDLPASEIEIRLRGAPEGRTPSGVDPSTAFFPNVAQNTDLAVSPTATGVETLTQIRSADAPMAETFDLALPDGARLREDGEGGAEVLDAGEVLLSVLRPSAMDAEGDPVPVALSVEGQAITLHVEPAEDTVYPILVDPVYETWFWELNHSTEGTSDWVSATNSPLFQPTTVGRYGEPGLNIYTLSGWVAPGTQANWNYHVPRFYSDQQNPEVHEMPTSWIQSATLTDLRWWFEEPGPPFPADPSLVMGLWDEFHQNWTALGVRTGYEGQLFDQSFRYILHDSTETTGEEDTHTKTAAVLLQSFESQSHPRHLLVGQAEVQVTDNDFPRFGPTSSPSAWVSDSPSSPIQYKVTDRGLGVNELSLWEPTIGGGSKDVLSWEPCFGNVSHPCPRTLTQAQLPLNYDPSVMPQGEDVVSFSAQDPLHHWSNLDPIGGWVQALIKVDHTPPEVALSGTLMEQASLGTHRPAYTLRVHATDGTEAAPQSGVVSTEVLVDNVKVKMPEEGEWNPNCTTRNCRVAAEWTLNAAGFSSGRHEVKVITRDAVHLATTKTFSIELQQAPPTLSVTGTLTEQSLLGTQRPRYTLKISDVSEAESPSPATAPSYNSAFGTAGTANGQFDHPADIALDTKGDLWVVDSANNRVEEFNEKGEFLTKFGMLGTEDGQLSRPTAISVDATGDIWVVDAQNGRIEEFNEQGEMLTKFGSGGPGDGQFSGSGPEGIAIDYHGSIWISDTSAGRLEKFSEGGGFLKSVGTPGTGAGKLGEPTGLDFGPGGNVWVADWRNNKVLEYGASGQLLREFGEEGTANGQFKHPDAVAVDSKGDVWVVDQNNERVQEFNQGGEYLGKFGGAGSGPGQFTLGFPVGIATDAKGDIWVTDTGNNRVEKWVGAGYSAAPGPTYMRSLGTAGSGAGHFSGVDGIAVDTKGDIWAADLNNSVIQRVTPAGEVLGVYGTSGTGNANTTCRPGRASTPATYGSPTTPTIASKS
jgi:sugar lactone lactonase YvrE